MKLKNWTGALVLAAVASVAGLAAADEAKKPANPAKTSDQASTDEKAMMEAWMKVATPGEGHKWL